MDHQFTAPQTGTYHIDCDPKANGITVTSTSHRLCFVSQGNPIRLIAATGDYFFWVPPGVKQWGIVVNGSGADEKVNATLFNSSGKKVWSQQNIAKPELFVSKRGASSKGEVWRLTLNRPTTGRLEDHDVQLLGLPSVLSLTPETLLMPKK